MSNQGDGPVLSGYTEALRALATAEQRRRVLYSEYSEYYGHARLRRSQRIRRAIRDRVDNLRTDVALKIAPWLE